MVFQTRFAPASDYVVVKEGDTLSEIAYEHIGHKVYGEYGSLQKLFSFNENISNPNLVNIGEKVNLNSYYRNNLKKARTSVTPSNVINNIRAPAHNEKEAGDSENENENGRGVRINDNGSKQIQSLYFSLSSSIANIETLDTKSNREEKVISDLGYGITGIWTHLWSDNFTGYIVGSIKRFDFKIEQTKTLNNESITQGFVGSGINYIYDHATKSKLSVGFGLGESIILKSTTDASTFKMDKAIIPGLTVSGAHNLISSKNNFTLKSFWRLGAFFPTDQVDFDTKWGYFYNIGLGSNYNLNGNIINYSVGYTGRKVNTGDATQTSKEVNFSLGYGWSF